MTFLGGPRACIGYQFTLIESVRRLHPPRTSSVKVLTTFTPRMKCLLSVLIRKFEFELTLPVEDIVWRNQAVVRRPFVKGAEKDGPKLPLYVKVHVPDA